MPIRNRLIPISTLLCGCALILGGSSPSASVVSSVAYVLFGIISNGFQSLHWLFHREDCSLTQSTALFSQNKKYITRYYTLQPQGCWQQLRSLSGSAMFMQVVNLVGILKCWIIILTPSRDTPGRVTLLSSKFIFPFAFCRHNYSGYGSLRLRNGFGIK